MPASVQQITEVFQHPENEHLTSYRLTNGAETVGNKLEDGSNRYQVGDFVGFVPADSIVPEWLLRHQDARDEEKNIGRLGGNRGNRVKVRVWKTSGAKSEGMMVKPYAVDAGVLTFPFDMVTGYVPGGAVFDQLLGTNEVFAIVDTDLTSVLGLSYV